MLITKRKRCDIGDIYTANMSVIETNLECLQLENLLRLGLSFLMYSASFSFKGVQQVNAIFNL